MLTTRATRIVIVVLLLSASILIIARHTLLAAEPVASQPIAGAKAQNALTSNQTHIALPAIDAGDGWVTRVHVQNTGAEVAVAVLELDPLIADTGQLCPKVSQEPVATLCSPPIEPHGTWTFELTADMGLEAAKAGRLFSVRPGTQDCDGGDGMRQPGAPVAVTVQRLRQATPGQPPVASVYAAPSEIAAITYTGRYYYWLPMIQSDDTHTSTVLYQNAGDECARTEVWYMPQGTPRAFIEFYDLAPGEAVRSYEVGGWSPPFAGQAWVRSDQPLGVVVDQQIGEAGLASYRGLPRRPGVEANFIPLLYKDFQGWRTEIRSQNAGFYDTLPVEAQFLQPDGTIVSTQDKTIAPYDSWAWPLTDNPEIPTDFAGMTHLAVGPKPSLSRPREDVPALFTVVNLVHKLGSAVSYTALPAIPREGVTELALPRLVSSYQDIYQPDGITQTSHVLIQNLNREPGETHTDLEIYDVAGGRVGAASVQLPSGEVEVVDLNALPFVPVTFRGSGRVRITPGNQAGTPSIGVVVLERPAQTVEGDLVTAYEGIPIVRTRSKDPPPTPTPPATQEPHHVVYLSLVKRSQ